MLESRTVFHVFNRKLAGKVISTAGESVRVFWSDGRIYSHDRKFLCDDFSDLDTSIKSRTVIRNEEQDEPDGENDPNQIGVYELGSEPPEQEVEIEEEI